MLEPLSKEEMNRAYNDLVLARLVLPDTENLFWEIPKAVIIVVVVHAICWTFFGTLGVVVLALALSVGWAPEAVRLVYGIREAKEIIRRLEKRLEPPREVNPSSFSSDTSSDYTHSSDTPLWGGMV